MQASPGYERSRPVKVRVTCRCKGDAGYPSSITCTGGRLVVAAQESYGEAVSLGIRPGPGSLTWTTVTTVGDLSGLAIAPDGNVVVAFSRIAQPGGASRIWLAHSPS